MRSFTAKELSRNPAKVFNAVKEDGSAKVTHDRYLGEFYVSFKPDAEERIYTRPMHVNTHTDSDGVARYKRPESYKKAPEGAD